MASSLLSNLARMIGLQARIAPKNYNRYKSHHSCFANRGIPDDVLSTNPMERRHIMPEFCNPFTVLQHERKLTHEELVRAIRFMIAAEYEAIQLYQQTAESTDNALAKEVLIDIANEEKEHAGEFLRLLKELDPEEEKFYKEGYEEVEEMIKELKK